MISNKSNNTAITVFLHPAELCFYALTPATLRQSLSIYNPFHNSIKFEVLVSSEARCTYSVKTPEGIIPACHHAELTIVNKPPAEGNSVIREKLKIVVKDARTAKDLGYRIVPLTLFPSEKDTNPYKDDTFKSLNYGGSSRSNVENTNTRTSIRPNVDTLSRVYVLTLCTVLLAILFIPTRQEPPHSESLVPPYLHVSELFKLMCAYVLGILTVVVLRPFLK